MILPSSCTKSFLEQHQKMVPLFLGLVAIVLTCPGVFQGLDSDDFILIGKIQNEFGSPGNLSHLLNTLKDLFVFAHPDSLNSVFSADFPLWWGDRNVKIAFFRPLSSFTHWLDGCFWPDLPSPMHILNIILFACIVVLVYRLFYRFTTPVWVAVFAGFLFAVDDLHMDTVKWISNRNSLLAFFFGILCITFHDKWHKSGSSYSGVYSHLFFTLSLLSAEGGVCTAAYLFAHALFIDNQRGFYRFRFLAVYILIGFLYVQNLSLFGYGASSTQLYVDPNHETYRFSINILKFVPILLLGLMAWPDPRYFSYCSYELGVVFWFVAFTFCLSFLGVMIPLLKREKATCFWLAGMVFSLIPVCSMGIPSERLLLFSSLGSAGLIAILYKYLYERFIQSSTHILNRLKSGSILFLLLFLHVIYAPVSLILESSRPSRRQVLVEKINSFELKEGFDLQDLVIVNPPSSFFLWYHRSISLIKGNSGPKSIKILAPGFGDVKIKREDLNTLQVTTNHGFFPPFSREIPNNSNRGHLIHPIYVLQLLEGTAGVDHTRLPLHSTVNLPELSIEVTHVTELGPPSQARFTFNKPLDSSVFRWIQWDWQLWKYKPFNLPAVGQETTIHGFWK